MDKKSITIISIKTYYANQIFNKTKIYEFRKSPLKNELLNKKIYIYSSKKDKAIIGYFKVDKVLNGNIVEILSKTGYGKKKDKEEIINYYGINNSKCYAYHLYEVTEFKEKLTLEEMKKVYNKTTMPQYIKHIYEDNPLYKTITEWDKKYINKGE